MRQDRGPVKNGIGSYKLKDGSTRYRVVYRANGEVHNRGGFKTKGAAQAYLNSAKVSVDTGTHVAPTGGRIRFDDWAEQWLTSVVDVRPSTKARDESYLRNYVMPTFGPMQLRQIDYAAVTKWVANLSASGRKLSDDPLAASTVHKAFQIMSKVMRSAVLAGKIARNPCLDVPLPRIEREEARFLDPDELVALEHAIEATERQRYRLTRAEPRLPLIIPFLADTGLRIGEAAALRWRDVNVAAGTVEVRETLVEVNGVVHLNPPKTKAGRRVVPTLTDEVAERLADRALRLGLGADDFMWQGEDGGVLRPGLFRRRVWKPALEIAGLADPQPTPHSLRHTAVAHWIHAGVVEPLKLQRWAGHRSTTTIYGVYGHLLPSDATDERRALSALRAGAQARAGERHLRAV